MKLPQDLQPHFSHAALIIVSDSVIAKFFLAGGDEMETLDGVAEAREERPDSEGKFSDEPNEEERLKKFIKKMVEHTEQLVRDHDIAHIHYVMPAEVEHHFVKALPADLKVKITRTLEHDLMKEDILKVVKRLFS